MKIALLIQNADRRAGGAEGYTLDLARSLGGRGHQVTLIAEEGPKVTLDAAAQAGVACKFLGAGGRHRWLRLKSFIARLRHVRQMGDFDVIHSMLPVPVCDVYQPHSGLAMEMWQTGHLKYRAGLVRRWAERFNRWNVKRRGLARIEEEMLSTRPWILCLSEAMRTWARQNMPVETDRLVVLINGINLQRFAPGVGQRARDAIRQEWQVGPEQRLALLVGNNFPLKGVGEAVAALGAQKDAQTMLMVVGRGNPEKFRQMAEKLGVSPRLHFIGSVIDTRPYYGAADYLLLPTKRDMCSLVVLEALAMGKPVVTTRQNGASDVITDGTHGIVLQEGDHEGLAGAMARLSDSRELARMSAAALALRSELSLDRHLERIEEVYAKVVTEKSREHVAV